MYDLNGNRIAEHDYDPGTGTATLLREFIWMDGGAVAVVEGGQMYFVRTDHIRRSVFATDGSSAKVLETMYLPFGGVQTSTGNNINLHFTNDRLWCIPAPIEPTVSKFCPSRRTCF